MADVGKGVAQFREQLQKTGLKEAPDWHVVLGSGFGASLDQAASENSGWSFQGEFSFAENRGSLRLDDSRSRGKVSFVQKREEPARASSSRWAGFTVMKVMRRGTRFFPS